MEIIEYLFINGEVITADYLFSVHEALAVKDKRIFAVGTTEQLLKLRQDKTKVIDLRGRTIMPGFIDAHAHLLLYGTNQLGVDCKNVHSIEEIKRRLKGVVRETPADKWIRGWGYNQNFLQEGRHLTRWDLDEVSTRHPIMVVRTCGHISCVNSKALEMAGINENSQNPIGGKYVRNRRNQLTGLLLEEAHMNMVHFSQHTKEEQRQAYQIASHDFLKAGITSIHDAGGYGPAHIRALAQCVQEKDINVRVYAMYGSLHNSVEMVQDGFDKGMVTGIGNEWFKVGPAKVFIDGSSSGPTAATIEPYTSNSSDTGILYLDEAVLNDTLSAAHDTGWQITAHAIGDRAVQMMIDCIEQALEKSPRTDHRHRIEHAAMTPPYLAEKMKELGIIPVANPAFIREFGDGYIKDYGERIHHMFPLQSFLSRHIPAAIGSDSPITTKNPLMGLYAMLTRESLSERVIGENERITLKDAIRMYTYNGAYASFDEGEKGSLEVGKLADLIVLNRSLLTSAVCDIPTIEVDATMVGGSMIYSKQKEVVL